LCLSTIHKSGIGKAEDLHKRLYEAQYKEVKAEDFDSPRNEEDGAREILNGICNNIFI